MAKKNAAKKKVLVALSGGIDSAVSAYLLLKQGFAVEAVFMKNWSSTTGLLRSDCPWLTDRQDALRVAAFLRIPLHTVDFEKQYQKTVMEYFFREYAAGRTPNPDVLCNKEIKFKLLYNWALEKGFDYMATGHYAQVRKVESRRVGSRKKRGGGKTNQNPEPATYHLMRSKDEFKDQTYFIYNLLQQQLPHVLFPVGGMKKSEVKKLAANIGLPNAGKKESMGLCFVGKIRLKDFLEQQLKAATGPIVNTNGNVLGKHEGLHNYTIGQRQGLHIGGSGPYYVVSKDLQKNLLVVTDNPKDKLLQTKEIQLHTLNWIDPAYSLLPTPYKLTGRFRHQGELVPLTISQADNKNFTVNFKHPQLAIASGQSLVLYKGKQCLGGGVIA